MSHLIYPDDEPPFTGRPVPYADQPAVRNWARHYANARYLQFMAERGDVHERRRALLELEVCVRRMTHWIRHQNWDAGQAALLRAEIDRQWATQQRRVP